MAKIHYRDDYYIKDAPGYLKDEYRKMGYHGSLCGYVRKKTTLNKDEVTCFYCKNILITLPF